jgi:hypothetical protein
MEAMSKAAFGEYNTIIDDRVYCTIKTWHFIFFFRLSKILIPLKALKAL